MPRISQRSPEELARAMDSAIEIFRSKTLILDGECLIWPMAPDSCGYGQVNSGPAGRYQVLKAHRVAWTIAHGPIPAGMVIDHRCHVRMCVNPDHLRCVTQKQNCENQRIEARSSTGVRGVYYDKARMAYAAVVGHNGNLIRLGRFPTLAAAQAAVIAKRNEIFTHNDNDRETATHCLYGHLLTDENVYLTTTGQRRCMTCHRREAREARKLKRLSDRAAETNARRRAKT